MVSVPTDAVICQHMTVQGVVQGVGFRPFVFRLATELGIVGAVWNTPQGVSIVMQAYLSTLDQFVHRILTEHPPVAHITQHSRIGLPVGNYTAFVIAPSDPNGTPTAYIPADLATCPACLIELHDPTNRRYGYPFINCTDCGPRFSLMTAMPYDRPQTTMHGFVMCAACQREYDAPSDRRFHAQPNACPLCGPQVALWDAKGKTIATRHDALTQTLHALREGQIVALKGVGGYMLMADATRPDVIERLRQRKHRPHKPFAVMFPNEAHIAQHCLISPAERALLHAPQAPIVLLDKAPTYALPNSIAPDNRTLGAFLPYSPLHHLILAGFDAPLIATSGNRGDEPICIDNYDALSRLRGIADLFLVHNRPIARAVDDSVAQIILDEPVFHRRARGYAPAYLPPLHAVSADATLPPLHAVGQGVCLGAHQKTTLALCHPAHIVLSQHIGDLNTALAHDHFVQTQTDLRAMLGIIPEKVACDLHPDYASTRHAESLGLPLLRVQHHHAHALACWAEHRPPLPALAVVWDGTGYGADGTIWGGEFLRLHPDLSYTRAGHVRPFPLLGGESAIHHPSKTALGLLYACFGEEAFSAYADLPPFASFSAGAMRVLQVALMRGINTPITSSMGRLFDAAAALMGVCMTASHEAQAPMMLEALAGDADATPYLVEINPDGIIDLVPLVRALVADVRAGVAPSLMSARLIETLVRLCLAHAQRAGHQTVLLTGGCFANKRLLTRCVVMLREAGFVPHWHQTVPCGDGGIALGQAVLLQASAIDAMMQVRP